MKKIFLIIFALSFVCAGNTKAQSLSDIFESNQELRSLFVNPAGLDQNIDSTDATSLNGELNAKDVPFNMFDMGTYGTIFILPQNKLTINGVDIDKTILVVNDNYSGIMYVSKPSDNFTDMCWHLDNQLKKLSISDVKEEFNTSGINVYMVSDKYGVGVINDPKRKVAMAALMDMKNLKSFLEMPVTL